MKGDTLMTKLDNDVWDYLTPDVMSEDEEDAYYVPPKGLKCRRFIVCSYFWRNPDAAAFFRVYDSLHLSTRFNSNGTPKAGRLPEIRVRCDRCIEGCAPPGLPENLYNPVWLRTLSPLQIRNLKMRPSVELKFSPEILRIAKRFEAVQHRHDKPLVWNHSAVRSIKAGGPAPAFAATATTESPLTLTATRFSTVTTASIDSPMEAVNPEHGVPPATRLSTVQEIHQPNTTASIDSPMEAIGSDHGVPPATSGAFSSLSPHSQGSSTAFNYGIPPIANGRAIHLTSDISHPLQPSSCLSPIWHSQGYAQQGHPFISPPHTWSTAYHEPSSWPPTDNAIAGPSTLRVDHDRNSSQGYSQRDHSSILPSHTWGAAYRAPGSRPPTGNAITGSSAPCDRNSSSPGYPSAQ